MVNQFTLRRHPLPKGLPRQLKRVALRGALFLLLFASSLTSRAKHLSIENRNLLKMQDTTLPCTATTDTINAVLCNAQTYSLNGTSYTASGSYTTHLTNAGGCDSAITLNLTIRAASASTFYDTVCMNKEVYFNGANYSITGIYNSTLTNINGCDSVATLNLTVNAPKDSIINDTICSGGSTTFNGIGYSSAGTYSRQFANASGCEIAATINLTVNPPFTKNIYATICSNQSYTINGTAYNNAGTYSTTYTNRAGCDSVVNYNLSVNNISTSTVLDTLHTKGSSFTFGGKTYNTAGTYYDTLTNKTGCDSVITIYITRGYAVLNYITVTGAGSKNGTSWANAYDSSALYSNPVYYALPGDTFWVAAGTYYVSFTMPSGIALYGGFAGTETALSQRNLATHVSTLDGSSSNRVIYMYNVSSNTVLDGFTVTNGNSWGGGGLYNQSSFGNSSNPVIAHCTFYNNYADNGAAIYNLGNGGDASPTIIDCIFNSNSGYNSGAIYNDGSGRGSKSSPAITNCLFINNSSSANYGGGIANAGYSRGFCQPIITNCTFSGNYAYQKGGGMGSFGYTGFCKPLVYNCIFWGNTTSGYGANLEDQNSTTFVSYSDVKGGWSGTGNINSDPLFNSSSDFSIQFTSPCKDAGSNSYVPGGVNTDLAGNARIVHTTVDMGAYEITALCASYNINTTVNLCTGQSLTYHGKTYTTSGSYIDTTVISGGCDSIVNLTINKYSNTTSAIKGGYCPGTTYTFNGTKYSAGSYTVKLTNVNGCDSTVSLAVTAYSNSSSTVNIFYCQGSSVTYNGVTYTTTGTRTVHLTNAKGCDSVVTLNVSMRMPTSTTISASICNGKSYIANGTSYSTTGYYLIHSTNKAGCDSTIKLSLTIARSSNSAYSASICSNTFYTFDGKAFNASGVYADSFKNTVGCDSIRTLTLKVNNTTSSAINVPICSGATYRFNNVSYTTAGTTIVHLTNKAGCDSAVSLTITVKPNATHSLSASICQGSSYNFSGTLETATGSYTKHFTSANGCDSAVTLNLVMNVPTRSTTYASICAGKSYNWNGTIYTVAGNYTAHFTNAKGCDSAAMVTLTVKKSSNSAFSASICSNATYTFDGKSYKTSGFYTDSFKNSAGCDSIRTLTLTVNNTTSYIVNAAICAGTSYKYNNMLYSTAGATIVHLTNKAKCDSSVTLNLTVNAKSATSISASVCAGHPYNFNGTTENMTGSYTWHTTNKAGCDSAVVLTLTVKRASNPVTVTSTSCSNNPATFDGRHYSVTGIYIDSAKNKLGCDSIRTLNLTVKQTSTSTITRTICQNQNFKVVNTTFGFGGTNNTSGNYTVHTTNKLGCDSAITVNLTVNKTYAGTSSVSICQPATYNFYGTTYSTSGTYGKRFTNVSGCDSFIVVSLTVNKKYNVTTVATICKGGYVTNNRTKYYVGTYTISGTTKAGCDSIVKLYVVNNMNGCKVAEEGTAIATNTNNSFTLYPNPTSGQFTIDVNTLNTTDNATVEVINLLGQVITQTVVANNNGNIHTTLFNNLAIGVYIVRVIVGTESQLAKVSISN